MQLFFIDIVDVYIDQQNRQVYFLMHDFVLVHILTISLVVWSSAS